MIYVHNKYKYHGPGEVIMRGTPLGNPFRIGPDGDRDEVIKKYQEWLDIQYRRGRIEIIQEIERLANIARKGDLHLICCCAPLKCHGDIIKKHLEEIQKV